MIAKQRGCIASKEVRVKRFSEHFREREGTLPLSLSEIGRAKLHGTTKIGATRGVAHSGPDQALGVRKSEEYFLHTVDDGTVRLFCENSV